MTAHAHRQYKTGTGTVQFSVGRRADLTNAIDEFTADSRGFTKSSRGYTRMYGGFADGFTNGFATDSREFARVRESSREFARVREGSRRIHGWIHNGYTADSRIDADSRTDSQWVHKGSYPMFTVHRRESVYGICSMSPYIYHSVSDINYYHLNFLLSR